MGNPFLTACITWIAGTSASSKSSRAWERRFAGWGTSSADAVQLHYLRESPAIFDRKYTARSRSGRGIAFSGTNRSVTA